MSQVKFLRYYKPLITLKPGGVCVYRVKNNSGKVTYWAGLFAPGKSRAIMLGENSIQRFLDQQLPIAGKAVRYNWHVDRVESSLDLDAIRENQKYAK